MKTYDQFAYALVYKALLIVNATTDFSKHKDFP